MKVAIIGRSELMYDTAVEIKNRGHKIPLIVTAKESPEFKVTAQHFYNFAKDIDATFIDSPNINSEKNFDLIKESGPFDIAVSINYSGIIESAIIDLFPLGILNAHGGDLPRYRGNACQAWAIISGEERIGLCIHKMIGGELDSGDIVSRDYMNINIDTRIGDVYKWIEAKTPSLVLSAIDQLEEQPTYVLEQQSGNPSNALRTYPRLPEDGKINWEKTNIDIIRLINSSSEPFSGSFCIWEGEELKIWRAQMENDNEFFLATPGQITKICANGEVVVACGDGKVRLLEVELKGVRQKPSNLIKSIRKRLY